jgi:hypothetical protein
LLFKKKKQNMVQALQKLKEGAGEGRGWDKTTEIHTAANMVISQNYGALRDKGHRFFKNKTQKLSAPH